MIVDQNMTLDIFAWTVIGWADGKGLYWLSPLSLSLNVMTLILVMSQITEVGEL